MKPVLFEKDGPIGWLTLNRPDKRNALSLNVMNDMLDNLKNIAQDQDIHVVVIKGNGPAFCAGHNLKDMVGADLDIHASLLLPAILPSLKPAPNLPHPVQK